MNTFKTNVLAAVKEICVRTSDPPQIGEALGALQNGKPMPSIRTALDLIELEESGAISKEVLARVSREMAMSALKSLARALRKTQRR